MTRVISGRARGRRLAVPAGRTTRPTSDRAREGLFSTVGSLVGPLDGLRVLDLFAGSGAVGLEALSRGAGHVMLVESDAQAVRAIQKNVEAVGLPGAVVVRDRVERVLARGPEGGSYDFAFADPPYAAGVDGIIAALDGWLAPDGVVAVERSAREPDLSWPEGFSKIRVRHYGEAAIWYGHRA